MLPDRSLIIGQKLVENAKIQNFKCDILSNFQTMWKSVLTLFFPLRRLSFKTTISFSLFSATLSLKSSMGRQTMSSRVRPQPAGTRSSALWRLFLGLSEAAAGVGSAWAGGSNGED